MDFSFFKNKKITVMGLGLHGGGVGIVKFLSAAGANVIATDLKSKKELAESIEKIKDVQNVTYVLGQHRPEDFTQVDMVVKNPCVPWNSKYIKLAIENKVPVEIDSSLFFKLCANPIIGVTGTKGKTTTASLIFEILKTAGKEPIKVGIGQTSVLDKLSKLEKDSVIVFELSSWRLSALGKYELSPQAAVITNILPDHLNYYKNMEEYIQDKKYIFSNQKKEDFCILNWDQEEIRKMENEVKAQLIKFSCHEKPGGKSVFAKDGAAFYDDGVDEKEVIKFSEMKLRGNHNQSNILASIAAALSFGISSKDIKMALISFQGIPHRLEFIKEIEGVKYFNDTSATTPESAMAGINSFTEPLILIAGGAEKNLDTLEFSKLIVRKTKNAVFLAGKSTEKVIENIKKISPEKNYPVVDSMQKAVETAREMAEKGDIVLLSPGASSFGLFANEFDRGDQFRETVANLK